VSDGRRAGGERTDGRPTDGRPTDRVRAGGVRIDLATRAAPILGRPNEDVAASGPGWAFVLDGATPAPGVATGCRHDVPWLVHRLTIALTARLTQPADAALAPSPPTPSPLAPSPLAPSPLAPSPLAPSPLADLLADAIAELRAAHEDTCDLDNPDSPSSTVAMVRVRGSSLDYLVLCDSPVVLRHADGRITLIEDDRLARLPGGPPYSASLIRARRNRPGGFWVASTDPAAAYQAVTGEAGPIGLTRPTGPTAPTAPTGPTGLTDAALFSDGVTRLAEWYGYPWPRILAHLRDQGPGAVIDLVRAAERSYPHPRIKQHDDATVVHLRW
jgi:Protein phosphatase 2C